jgi:hypothetical protein
MNLTKREIAVSSLFGGSAIGIGLLSSDSEPEFRRGGVLSSQKPFLKNVNIASDRRYPYEYHALIRNEEEAERIRWDYFHEVHPVYAEKFQNVNLSDGFFIFAGLVLPETKQLDAGYTEFDDGKIRATYRVLNGQSRPEGISIQTAVGFWKAEGRLPSDLSVEYRFGSDSI